VFKILMHNSFISTVFDIAHAILLQPSKLHLSAANVESICLSVSREFYDNASSGNYKTGDMKLAYDWSAFTSVSANSKLKFISASPSHHRRSPSLGSVTL